MSRYTEILKEANKSIEKLIEMGPDLSSMNDDEKSEVLKMMNVSNYANELISLGFTLDENELLNFRSYYRLSIYFIEAFNLDPLLYLNKLSTGEYLKLLEQSLSGERLIDNEQIRYLFKYLPYSNLEKVVKLMIELDEMTGFMNYKKGELNYPMKLSLSLESKELIDYIYNNYLDMLNIESLFKNAIVRYGKEAINYYLEKERDIVDRCVNKAIRFFIKPELIELLYPHASDPQKFADWIIQLYVFKDDECEPLSHAKIFNFLLDHYTMDEIIKKIEFYSEKLNKI